MALEYELTKQFSYGLEKVIAKFADEKDALEFMEAKVAWDHKTKVVSVYRLYRFGAVIKEVDATEHESIDSSAASSGSGKHFNPSPLSTTLRPAGITKTDTDDDLI